MIELCQSLRFQVYCQERSFLDPADFPNKIERDQYDAVAWHFATLSRRRFELAGTVRLIPHTTSLGLPISQHCHIWPRFDPTNNANNGIDVARIAEISRLAISRSYRRRQLDNFYGDSAQPRSSPGKTNSGQRERRAPPRPLIVLGLYAAYYRECKRQGINRWYAAMEPALVRLLSRFGIEMQRIGPDTDYYGKVAPYSASIQEMEATLAEKNPRLLLEFAGDLETDLRPVGLSSV